MRNSFGTFTTLQGEKEFARYIFWSAIEVEAREVIEDLNREPFQAYRKAHELNGEIFHHQAFGYPASEVFFVNFESVKEFHNTLAVWQKKYNLCYSDENLIPLSFDEYFVYSHNDFFPNIASQILKMPENETFQKFNNLSEAGKDEIRIKYIQSKKWIVDGSFSTANQEIAEKFLESLKASYKAMPEEKLKNLKSLETDWIPKKACEFLWYWSDYPKDFEDLFLMNGCGTTGFIDESFPKGLEEFRAHFETPQIYAERMADKVKSDLKTVESISIASNTK